MQERKGVTWRLNVWSFHKRLQKSFRVAYNNWIKEYLFTWGVCYFFWGVGFSAATSIFLGLGCSLFAELSISKIFKRLLTPLSESVWSDKEKK